MHKIFIICSIFFSGILLGTVEHITLNESTLWLKKVKINIDFTGGKILLKPADSENKISGFMEYNPDFILPKLEFTSVARTGILDMATDFHFEYEIGKSDKAYGNSAELNLPTSTPLKFNLDFSLAEVELNLKKIKISSFNFDLGMGSANVDFGENFISNCNFLTVDVGMGSAEFNNFGNIYCEDYEIDCGMGKIIIHFPEILEEDQDIDLSVGMGSIEVNIIEGNNIKVEMDQSMLSSLDFERMDLIKTNIYRNEDFDKSKPTLAINASIGLGKLAINWIK